MIIEMRRSNTQNNIFFWQISNDLNQVEMMDMFIVDTNRAQECILQSFGHVV